MIILPICMNISYHWQFLLQRVAVAQSSHGALQNDKSTSLFQVLFSLLLTLLYLSKPSLCPRWKWKCRKSFHCWGKCEFPQRHKERAMRHLMDLSFLNDSKRNWPMKEDAPLFLCSLLAFVTSHLFLFHFELRFCINHVLISFKLFLLFL